MKKFVIVVDAQKDFMKPTGLLSVPGAEPVIGNINDFLLDVSGQDYEGVLFTFDTHTQPEYDNSEEGGMFPPHCILGTDGWELAVNPKLLGNRVPVYTLRKGVFDMWQEPKLSVRNSFETEFDRDDFFTDLMKKGVDTVVLLGVCSDVCVEQAAKGLVERNFKVEVVAECVRGIKEQIEEVVEKRLPTLKII